ncbi:uncharacterized protein LOC129582777 isoform X1 [Paramacrobiotus metropolitanus]|uniref:uncharacterized protein LOC129582777 isoform X1 n=1 Tax=Paramacrobiotus metropolitanus TaxID=2943436 RepID=UPI00244580E1|nr:uncharacterized protein LOC129582777 isoform X1 [Paramacrobiotus metropolitanus]
MPTQLDQSGSDIQTNPNGAQLYAYYPRWRKLRKVEWPWNADDLANSSHRMSKYAACTGRELIFQWWSEQCPCCIFEGNRIKWENGINRVVPNLSSVSSSAHQRLPPCGTVALDLGTKAFRRITTLNCLDFDAQQPVFIDHCVYGCNKQCQFLKHDLRTGYVRGLPYFEGNRDLVAGCLTVIGNQITRITSNHTKINVFSTLTEQWSCSRCPKTILPRSNPVAALCGPFLYMSENSPWGLAYAAHPAPLQRLDMRSGFWERMQPLSAHQRRILGMFSYGDHLLTFGDELNADRETVKTVQCYDAHNSRWVNDSVCDSAAQYAHPFCTTCCFHMELLDVL